jgi:hypothetical protein
VDDLDFRLEHFRRFLRKWNSLRCDVEVPGVDFAGAWVLNDAAHPMREMKEAFHGIDEKRPYWSGVADIDDWLRAYRENDGYYEEWPNSLAPGSLDAGYSDAAALGLAAVQTIRKGYASRKELVDEHRQRHFAHDKEDALSIRTIAQNETDFWLGTLVARLARAQTLPPAHKRDLGKRLQEALARYPRKKFGARIKIANLQSYLSLPIWQKRHELYAVWIATEILNALPDHICEIHHDNGKIVFAFRETLVATVKSAWPRVRVISERRARLDNPVGKGRTGNVQPDYGLWRTEGSVETCGLVIEVKHYKRSASLSFGHALTDYARAFPKAEVYLVNHGPIGDATSDVPHQLSNRCHTIKHLIVPHQAARDELREAVRKYVGDPVAWESEITGAGKRSSKKALTVLAIDVSPSMSGYLGQPEFFEIVRSIAGGGCATAALIDVQVRKIVPLDKLPEAVTSTHGSATNLAEPVRELLGNFERVLLITDEEGLESLQELANKTIISRHSALIAIEVPAK